ncbi:MAG TPA: formate dehydrogenase accessory sulfurtransferase FdhD [Firmicutes bacterium]|nr:formate dehydrogenase accessory sulfurtransferase FdhD [Bacillota bacterium]
MSFLKNVQIKQYKNGKYSDKSDIIIEEKNLDIFINGNKFSVRLLSEHIEYFIYGYLFTNFFISSLDDLVDLNIDKNEIKVKIKEGLNIPKNFALVSSCFSSGEAFAELSPVEHLIEIDPELIIRNTELFVKQGRYFEETGGTHLAALFKEDELIISFEDIGRHNAIDKITGYILKEKISTEDHMIFTTGRISSEIVKKIIRANVPLIVSRSAVTCAAINTAQIFNLKVIGFSRNKRFNLYT